MKTDWVAVGENAGQWDTRLEAQRLDKVLGLVWDVLQLLVGGCPAQLNYALELVHVVLAGEQRAAEQQLSHDAADRPHVNRLAIVLPAQDHLRSPVPTGLDVAGLGHQQVLVLLDPGKAKVA